MTSQDEQLVFYCTRSLVDDQMTRWRSFASELPSAHYRQDPMWAEIERSGKRREAREPWFFWGEVGGSICLTAVGVRRRLPIPGHAFWEFNRGPNFVDAAALDKWLPWLLTWVGRGTARVRVQPPTRLNEGGDDVETVLERHGFERHRMQGGWTTLLVDLAGSEEEIMAQFRPATQRAIRKSRDVGIEVEVQDTLEGWQTLAGLQSELARRAPVPLVDKPLVERVSRYWLRGGSGGTVLVAHRNHEALAAALLITYRDTAYLPVIPSSVRNRDLPSSHLLVWEAARWARQRGCARLDLVGYSMTAQPGDPLWGVNQFKRGFAQLDHLARSVAVHEIVLSPLVAGHGCQDSESPGATGPTAGCSSNADGRTGGARSIVGPS